MQKLVFWNYRFFWIWLQFVQSCHLLDWSGVQKLSRVKKKEKKEIIAL